MREQDVLRDIAAALLSVGALTPDDVYPLPFTDAELDAIDQAAGLGPMQPGANPDPRVAVEQPFIEQRKTLREAWGEFLTPSLPFQVLPPEGFPNLSYFWTTMGQGAVWRPVVYLIASVPIRLRNPIGEFAPVTTMTTVTGITRDAPTHRLVLVDEGPRQVNVIERVPHEEEPWHQIGGRVTGPVEVVDPNDRTQRREDTQPILLALVTLQLPGDDAADPPRPAMPLQQVWTDEEGQYQFIFAGTPRVDSLAFETPYEIVVSYPGLTAPTLRIDLNAARIRLYDVALTKAP